MRNAILGCLVCLLLVSSGCASSVSVRGDFLLVPPSIQKCVEELPQNGWVVEENQGTVKLLSRITENSLIYVLVFNSPMGVLLTGLTADFVVGPDIRDKLLEECGK